MSDFPINQRIECINDRLIHGYGDEELPIRGTVYTVRGYGFSQAFQKPMLLLNEIVNQPRHYQGEGFVETGWPPYFFRIVHTTSIEIFTNMLVAPQVPA